MCPSVNVGFHVHEKKKLVFNNFPATLASQRRKPKRLLISQRKDKRPALQQGPDLYLEPKWLRCLCADLVILSCRPQQSAAGSLLFLELASDCELLYAGFFPVEVLATAPSLR